MLEMLLDSDNYRFSNPYSLGNAITAAIFLFLGIFIIYKDRKRIDNWIIGLFCISSFWWNFFFFFAYNALNYDLIYFLIKLGFIGVIFLLPTSFQMGFILLKGLGHKIRHLFYFNYGFAVILTVLLFSTDWILSAPIKHFWGYYTTAGRLFIPYLAYFSSVLAVIIIALGYFIFFRKKDFNDQEYKQLVHFFSGFLICSIGAVDFLPNFGLDFYPFGNIAFTIFALIISYGIIKYNIFDIETVFHKTIAWAVMSVIVLFPAFFYISFNVEYLRKLSVPSLLVFVAIVFYIDAYLRSKIQPRIDYIFQRKAYKNQEALAELDEILFNSSNLAFMGDNLLSGIREIFFTRRSCLLIKRHGDFQLQACFPKDKKIDSIPDTSDAVFRWVLKNKTLLYRNRVLAENKNFELDGRKLDWPQNNRVEVLVPVIFKSEIIGLILMDKKDSLKDYSAADLELLETIAKDAAMAMNNFLQSEKLLDQEKLMQRNLQIEIDKRTKELQDKNMELKKFNDMAVDRELKMIELKNRIDELEKTRGSI